MKSWRAIWLRTRNVQLVLLIVTIFVAGFALGSQSSISSAQSSQFITPEPEVAEKFAALWQTYNVIQDHYIDGDEVEIETLVDGAVRGMVESLGDPFSGYMDAELYPIVLDDFDGTVTGIGAIVRTNVETGEIVIASVLEGSPAIRAGIEEGDIFHEVDGGSTEGMSQLELVTKVRGPAGSEVDLVFRRGEELVEFTIVRDRVEVPNIESEVLDSNIGYIRLYEFNGLARRQIDDALASLDAVNLDGLIIDLRGNPGGGLTYVKDVISAFVPGDDVIVIEEFNESLEDKEHRAVFPYSGVSVPLVILVDETSASASELMAGALQDLEVATIIGETTFGKGTVQRMVDLVNGGGVRLTVARWLTPDRHWIHEQGVTPDIEVEWDPESIDEPDLQLEAALDFLTAQVAETE
jgi:carboxyl-terminal processing protease